MSETMTSARIALGAALAERDAKVKALEAADATLALADDQIEAAYAALREAEAAGRDRRDALVESIRKAASGAAKGVAAPKEGAALTNRKAAVETAEAARDVLAEERRQAEDALRMASLAVDIATAGVLREEFDRQHAECMEAIAMLERRHYSMNALVHAAATFDPATSQTIGLVLDYDTRRLLTWNLPPAPHSSANARMEHAGRWRAYRAALKADPAAALPADLAD